MSQRRLSGCSGGNRCPGATADAVPDSLSLLSRARWPAPATPKVSSMRSVAASIFAMARSPSSTMYRCLLSGVNVTLLGFLPAMIVLITAPVLTNTSRPLGAKANRSGEVSSCGAGFFSGPCWSRC